MSYILGNQSLIALFQIHNSTSQILNHHIRLDINGKREGTFIRSDIPLRRSLMTGTLETGLSDHHLLIYYMLKSGGISILTYLETNYL